MAKKLQLHGTFPTTPGPKGDPFTYEDFTPEQLEALKGKPGDPGPKGEPFTYEDFTPEQLESLKGEPGESGSGVYVGTDENNAFLAELFIDLDDDETTSFVEAPPTAEVGQTIIVKSIDDNGRPTEWEAVDLPTVGGSESGWELVANLTVDEAVQSVSWDNLNYRELKIYAYNPEGSDAPAYVMPKINGISIGTYADEFAFSGNFFKGTATTAVIDVFAFGDFAILSLNDQRVFSKEAIGKYSEISSFTWASFGKPENDAAIRAGGRYIVYGRK